MKDGCEGPQRGQVFSNRTVGPTRTSVLHQSDSFDVRDVYESACSRTSLAGIKFGSIFVLKDRKNLILQIHIFF